MWAVLNPDQSEALSELIKGQSSDRVVAIVGGAMLDDSLRRALETRMRPKDGATDMNEKMFKVGGALGNTGPKVDLGYQLWMLDKPARNTMHGLSEIRNLLAHNLSMTFGNSGAKMTDAFGKLTMHEGRTHYPSPFWDGASEFELDPVATRRDLFFVNLKLALIWLMADLHKHEPWSNTPTGVKRAAPLPLESSP